VTRATVLLLLLAWNTFIINQVPGLSLWVRHDGSVCLFGFCGAFNHCRSWPSIFFPPYTCRLQCVLLCLDATGEIFLNWKEPRLAQFLHHLCTAPLLPHSHKSLSDEVLYARSSSSNRRSSIPPRRRPPQLVSSAPSARRPARRRCPYPCA
jgi:hypothetical protein